MPTLNTTVLAAVPWAQDHTAEQNLLAVQTAESVTYVHDSRYLDWDGLLESKRIEPSDTITAATDENGTCYVAVAASATGIAYYTTSLDQEIVQVTATSTPGCITDIQFAALTTSVGNDDTPAPASLQSIAAGESHTVAIDAYGTLWAWGRNDLGQLGDGSVTQRNTPVPVSAAAFGSETIVSIIAGQHHTVALGAGGTLWAWGYNYFGQLGDGSVTQRTTPVPVSTAAFGTEPITSVTAGYGHTVALGSAGTLWAWGNNGNGQLGDGSVTQRTTPVPVSAFE